MKPVLSVVFSFRNEQDVLEELIVRLTKALKPLGLAYELIFVNDSSSDRSLDILKNLSQKDPSIRVLNMSRRFGVEPCFLAGFQAAQGDAVITMDTDLQDPPELIPQLVEKWRGGADVVHGVRSKREGESWIRLRLVSFAYWFLDKVGEVPLPYESGMYKLMSRRAINELLKAGDRDHFLRWLTAWVGFKQEFVYYVREARFKGTSHIPLVSAETLIHFLTGLTSFSQWPLIGLWIVGFCVLAATLMGFVAAAALYAFGILQSASWLPTALIFLLLGILIFGVGFVGVYVGRIYHQVKCRPLYILESKIGYGSES